MILSFQRVQRLILVILMCIVCLPGYARYSEGAEPTLTEWAAFEVVMNQAVDADEAERKPPFIARLLNIDPDSPPDLVVFLGRFHPLVVHLPISFILLALIIEVISRFKRFSDLKPASSFVLFLGVLTAAVAVIAGLLLSISGEYEGDTMFWHKWLGISVFFLAAAAYYFKRKTVRHTHSSLQRVYAGLLTFSGICLIFASHYGGSLTHGTDYLTSYMPEPLRSWAGLPPRESSSKPIILTNVEEAHIYEDIISPILDARCTTCHNSNKKKGDLLLTSPEHIYAGGESGSIIEAGSPDNSELFRRIILPSDDDDRMPPSGRRPLSDEYISLIGWWIEEGAPFDQQVGQLSLSEDIQTILDRMSSEAQEAALAIQVPPASSEDLNAVTSTGATVIPISQETNLLQAQFLNVSDPFSDEHMALLLPLSEQIAWLDLGKTAITDEAMPLIGNLTNLTKLHLEKTAITDNGLVHLQNLNRLEYLNLYGTQVSDEGLKHLSPLKNLRSLYLWQSRVTPEGAKWLNEAIPELEINLGWEAGVPSPPDVNTTSD